MKRSQKIIAGFLAVSAAFFGVASTVSAECDAGMSHGRMMRHDVDMGAKMAERAAKRMAHFHEELKLTPAQEPLWQAFAEKAQAQMGKGMQTTRANMSDPALSAPERMDRMQTAMKERVLAMEGVHEAFKSLYNALGADQKATADRHFSHMAMGNHHHSSGKKPRTKPAAPAP